MGPGTTAQYYRCPLSKYFFISGTEMYYGDTTTEYRIESTGSSGTFDTMTRDVSLRVRYLSCKDESTSKPQ